MTNDSLSLPNDLPIWTEARKRVVKRGYLPTTSDAILNEIQAIMHERYGEDITLDIIWRW
jgi:hypothetical protein